MSRAIETLSDGTRRYANSGTRYKPVAPQDRVYASHRPDDPRAVRFHANWFLPLDLLPEEDRDMPETRPDDQTLLHKASCRCDVCIRPQANELWRKARA